LAVIFLGTCLLNWSVESMLEVQAGVVWTVVIAFVLFTTADGNSEEHKVIERA
jgi:hypothetical protein